MLRSLLATLLLLLIPGCDATEPEEERTTGQQRVEISGFQLYGVDGVEESDGRIVYRVADEIDGVFRFGALPRVEVTDPCAADVDVCSSLVVNRPTAVEVTLSQPVVVAGETLAANTDLAEYLSMPDQDALLSIPPDIPDVPNASVFVAFDPGLVGIPDGEVRVSVLWTTNSPTVAYSASTTVTYTR